MSTDASSARPTGTVTFFFSDIEGSTKLLNRLGERYPALLQTHQGLMREAFERTGGVEVSTEGDSFFVAFPSASDAVAAAVAAQRALAAYDWGEEGPVRVRMGLHTGEGRLGGDNYVGIDVNRAARIMSAGHGGQILLSEATRPLVRGTLPEGSSLRDLGEHRLKDLAEPEHLFQVDVEGLPAEFPALKTLERRVAGLPEQLTTFVGRSRELDEIVAALGKTRLLTLTGPGGTGKTRLSIEVARRAADAYEDGAAFVLLASLRDPALVVPTIAQTLGLPEDPNRAPIEVVADLLRDKEILVVLDNFEQLVEAAPDIGQLLSLTTGATFLVTSRERLGIHGEREYQVPPLGLPDVEHLGSLEATSQYEAVALFIERAEAVKPGFAITNENAPAVAEITSRLDGLPLAIELAAARVKILTPQAILSRLEKSLSLLVGGARDLPARQQTLRDAIAWSYDLLEGGERRFFDRVAIFRGGFSLEAAEEVCNPGDELGFDTFECVASLVNKSLIRQMDVEGGEPRFFMLDTIREFANERLAEAGEMHETAERHGRFYLALVERVRPELTGPLQAERLDTLEREHHNIRAVLDRSGAADAEEALRMAGAVWRFWQFRGHLHEARARLEAVLQLPGAERFPGALAAAHEAAGGVVYWMGDHPEAARHYERSLELYRQVGDPRAEAEALYNLSFPYLIAQPPFGDIPRGREYLEESRRIFEDLDDQAGLAKTSWGLGNLFYRLEDYDAAEQVLRESLEANRRLDDRFGAGWALHTLGIVLLRKDEPDAAMARFHDSLELFAAVKDASGITLLLADFAAALYEKGDEHDAARLAGAAFTLQESSGTELVAFMTQDVRWREAFDKLQEDPALQAPLEEGRRMSTEEAVAFALSLGDGEVPG